MSFSLLQLSESRILQVIRVFGSECAQKWHKRIAIKDLMSCNVCKLKDEYLEKSNQVCARMEIEISDCQPANCKKFLILS
jgi:hypothetical protein